MKFCGNKLCDQNKIETEGIITIRVALPNSLNYKEVRNHEYRDRFGAKRFYLCDTCQRAADMVKILPMDN